MRKSPVQKDMSSAVWQQNGDGERPKQYFAKAMMCRCEQKGDLVQSGAGRLLRQSSKESSKNVIRACGEARTARCSDARFQKSPGGNDAKKEP